MGLFSRLTDALYSIRGAGVPIVLVDDFGRLFAEVLDAMVPSFQIVNLAGTDISQDWDISLESQTIDAHVAHLVEVWQPAHNAMQDVKPEKRFQRVHRKAMMASRAYGETLITYIEYRRMFLSDQFGAKLYFRKQRDGRQYDALTREYTRGLIDELVDISTRNPQESKVLLPSGIPNGVENIGAEQSEVFPQPAVCPFGIC